MKTLVFFSMEIDTKRYLMSKNVDKKTIGITWLRHLSEKYCANKITARWFSGFFQENILHYDCEEDEN